MSRQRRSIRGERGQTMTEFAVILPIFLMLLLGIGQGGIALNHYLALTDAARAGARYGAVLRTSDTRVTQTTAKVKASAANLDAAKLSVTITSTWDPGADLRVCASYPFSINLIGLVVKSGNLNTCTTNRVE
jgi:Flp pilus assembly protein TadG